MVVSLVGGQQDIYRRFKMLPQKLYESLRWIIAVILPAIGVFIVSIDAIWCLGLPAEEISLTLDAIGLFLGTVFGISKIIKDKEG